MSITQWFLSIPFNLRAVIAYLVLINVVTFFFFGADKLRAQLGKRRISERTLWLLSAIGGSAGAFLAMDFFRHKTKKASFQLGFVLIFVIQIALLLYFF